MSIVSICAFTLWLWEPSIQETNVRGRRQRLVSKMVCMSYCGKRIGDTLDVCPSGGWCRNCGEFFRPISVEEYTMWKLHRDARHTIHYKGVSRLSGRVSYGSTNSPTHVARQDC